MVDVSDAIARVTAATSHYGVLGVSFDTSDRELKAAYRSLSLALHPDKCAHPESAAAFKKVSEAHAILSDPLRRRSYEFDRLQRAQAPPQQQPSAMTRASTSAPAPWMPAAQPPPKPLWESAEDRANAKVGLLERENRELERELKLAIQELHHERGLERERHRKHDAELSVQRRLAAEARAEREGVRREMEERLAEERAQQRRTRQEDASRIEQLQLEARAAREEVELLHNLLERVKGEVEVLAGRDVAATLANRLVAMLAGGDISPDVSDAAPPPSCTAGAAPSVVEGPALPPSGHPAARPPAVARSVEKDAFGNYVVIERDASTGAATVSAARLHAEAARAAGSRTAPSMPRSARHAGDASDGCASGGGAFGDGAFSSGAASSGGGGKRSMSAALEALLRRLGLGHLIGRFEEEEIVDLPLLRSFGPQLAPNMREIGVDEARITQLQAALATG